MVLMSRKSTHGYGFYTASTMQEGLLGTARHVIDAALVENDGKAPHVVDIGAGQGHQALRMAKAGAYVTMADVFDARTGKNDIEIADMIANDKMDMICKDWHDLSVDDFKRPIDIVYSQRSLSYVSYQDVITLFNLLKQKMNNCVDGSAYVFAAFNGLDSFYGMTHPLRDEVVFNRHGFVSERVKEKMFVTSKMTVYSEDEVKTLMTDILGFYDIRTYVTRFDNIQVAARYKAL